MVINRMGGKLNVYEEKFKIEDLLKLFNIKHILEINGIILLIIIMVLSSNGYNLILTNSTKYHFYM
jgi:hypothetical protein